MQDGGWCVSSESCALDTLGAEFVRDVLPGEIVTIDSDGVHSNKTHCKIKAMYAYLNTFTLHAPTALLTVLLWSRQE